MNVTHIMYDDNEDVYRFPIVDSEIRKVAYTNSANTVAKFGFYDKNYISIDDEGISFCQDCKDPVTTSSFLGTTTIKPNGGIYFDNSFMKGNLIFQTNMPNEGAALPAAEYYNDNISVCDENENVQACFRYIDHPTLGQGMQIKARYEDDINYTLYENQIFLGIKPDGTRTISITDPAKWRYALGFGEIGTLAQQMPAGIDINSGQNKLLATQTFSAGVWVITYTANFVANPTGFRTVWLANDSDENFLDRYSGIEIVAPPSLAAMLVSTTMRQFSSSTTLRLFAKQTSGTKLNTAGGIYAIKIR